MSEQIPEIDVKIKEANKLFECGISSGNKVQLNVDGLEITAYPWLVLLEYQSMSSHNQIRCAGVIVDDRYILTSANCAKQSPISIRFGEMVSNCTRNDNTLYLCAHLAEYALISETRTHSSAFQFNERNIQDSLALLRLSNRLEFNEFVRPICLNKNETGFERSDKFFYPQWDLKLNKLPSESFIKSSPVKDITACNEAHGSSFFSLQDKLICVSPGRVLSGGPLVHVEFGENDERKSYVVGVRSFTKTQCQTDEGRLPDIYTKVSSYSNWIRESMKDY